DRNDPALAAANFLLVFIAIAEEVELDRDLLFCIRDTVEDCGGRCSQYAFCQTLHNLFLEFLLAGTDQDGHAGSPVWSLTCRDITFNACLAGTANRRCCKTGCLGSCFLCPFLCNRSDDDPADPDGECLC